jgi:hypothetical protein
MIQHDAVGMYDTVYGTLCAILCVWTFNSTLTIMSNHYSIVCPFPYVFTVGIHKKTERNAVPTQTKTKTNTDRQTDGQTDGQYVQHAKPNCNAPRTKNKKALPKPKQIHTAFTSSIAEPALWLAYWQGLS